jgi:excisionase family DNA binding protein
MTTELISLAEAARRSGMSRRTLGRMLADGRLRGERAGSSWNVDAESLAEISPPRPVTITNDDDLADDDRLQAAQAAADHHLAIIETLTADVADWRRRAEVAEALAEERATRLAELDVHRAQQADQLSQALRDLRDAIAISMTVAGAAGDGRRHTTTDLVIAPRRRWWTRSR